MEYKQGDQHEWYVEYFKKEVNNLAPELTDKQKEYLNSFRDNLNEGIEYYRELFPKMVEETKEYRDKAITELQEPNKKKRRDSAWIEQQDVTETQDAILRGMHIFLPEDTDLQRSRLTVPDITIPDKTP